MKYYRKKLRVHKHPPPKIAISFFRQRLLIQKNLTKHWTEVVVPPFTQQWEDLLTLPTLDSLVKYIIAHLLLFLFSVLFPLANSLISCVDCWGETALPCISYRDCYVERKETEGFVSVNFNNCIKIIVSVYVFPCLDLVWPSQKRAEFLALAT